MIVSIYALSLDTKMKCKGEGEGRREEDAYVNTIIGILVHDRSLLLDVYVLIRRTRLTRFDIHGLNNTRYLEIIDKRYISERADADIGGTHKQAVMKMTVKPILSLWGRCNAQISGIGMQRI